jgi:hypothetical protein
MKIRIPSPSMIVAVIALLCALSGTATAAALITGAQIKNNTVSSLDLTNNGVKSVDVLNGSLKAVDFAPGQLPAGPAGPAGPQGPAGPAGPQGAPGVAALEIVMASTASDSTGSKIAEATCPGGKVLVGGGARIVGAAGNTALDESYPLSQVKWRATATEVNVTGVNWRVDAFAICAAVAA